jgi:hypothetical protein
MKRQRQRHAWLMCKESSSVRDRALRSPRIALSKFFTEEYLAPERGVAFAAPSVVERDAFKLRRDACSEDKKATTVVLKLHSSA